MSRAGITNVSASIQDRLMNQARLGGRPFNELLQYYAIERFLFRLSQSRYKDHFILKGALLFRLWGLPGFRPTRDIDLLGSTRNELQNIVNIFKEICSYKVQEDGLLFDPQTVTAERIQKDADYEGIRVRLIALLGKARIYLQVDIGFGDVISPGPVMRKYPSIFSMPGPDLNSYPPETVIAEKIQAMITLGAVNSRLKDFYDVWILADRFEFNGIELQVAIRRTFENRDTGIPAGEPVAFSPAFAKEHQAQWEAFLQTAGVPDAPPELESLLVLLRKFLLPVFADLKADRSFNKTWIHTGWK